MKNFHKLKWIVMGTTLLKLAGCNQQNRTESNATDVTNENILFLDADDSVATAKMGKKEFDYASVLAAIENDSSITEEQKTDLLSEVMNGRWFSYELDKKYHNLSEYDQ